MILSVCLAYTGKSKYLRWITRVLRGLDEQAYVGQPKYLRKLMFSQTLEMSGQKIRTLGENVPICDRTKQSVLSQLQECSKLDTLLQLSLFVYQ